MPYDRSKPNLLPGPGDLADCPPPGWFADDDDQDDDPPPEPDYEAIAAEQDR